MIRMASGQPGLPVPESSGQAAQALDLFLETGQLGLRDLPCLRLAGNGLLQLGRSEQTPAARMLEEEDPAAVRGDLEPEARGLRENAAFRVRLDRLVAALRIQPVSQQGVPLAGSFPGGVRDEVLGDADALVGLDLALQIVRRMRAL